MLVIILLLSLMGSHAHHVDNNVYVTNDHVYVGVDLKTHEILIQVQR